MEGEVELVTESRTNGWCNDVTVSDEVEEKPEPLDVEHAVDDCIKDWQLGLRSYEAPQESVTVRPSSRRTVRTASTTKPDENTKPASTYTAPRTETGNGSSSSSRLESSNHAGSSLENIGLPGAGENCSKDSKLARRVSFKGEVESSQSPNPPEGQNEAPSTVQDSKDCSGSAPAVPAKCVKRIVHGVGPREGVVLGASPLPLPELEPLARGSPFRHSCAQVRPLDPIGEGSCKFDSSSRDFMSGPLASSQSQEFEDDSNLSSPSVLLRCNARRQHDEEEEDDDEDFKVGLFCGTRSLAYTNASRGDFVRLLSKLCLAVPLSKQSAAKVSQDSRSSGREVSRSSSISSQVCSWENNQNPSDDYIVFGRQNTLKLLCERCSNESIPSYNVHKPRKIRDHEPHQHFYKTISKTLDRKLRS